MFGLFARGSNVFVQRNSTICKIRSNHFNKDTALNLITLKIWIDLMDSIPWFVEFDMIYMINNKKRDILLREREGNRRKNMSLYIIIHFSIFFFSFSLLTWKYAQSICTVFCSTVKSYFQNRCIYQYDISHIKSDQSLLVWISHTYFCVYLHNDIHFRWYKINFQSFFLSEFRFNCIESGKMFFFKNTQTYFERKNCW